jgi:hypothetical protein
MNLVQLKYTVSFLGQLKDCSILFLVLSAFCIFIDKVARFYILTKYFRAIQHWICRIVELKQEI